MPPRPRHSSGSAQCSARRCENRVLHSGHGRKPPHGHRPLRGRGRLDPARRAARPRGAAAGHVAVVRADVRGARAPRRHGGEVHRRRRDGRLRDSGAARGRCIACGPRRNRTASALSPSSTRSSSASSACTSASASASIPARSSPETGPADRCSSRATRQRREAARRSRANRRDPGRRRARAGSSRTRPCSSRATS